MPTGERLPYPEECCRLPDLLWPGIPVVYSCALKSPLPILWNRFQDGPFEAPSKFPTTHLAGYMTEQTGAQRRHRSVSGNLPGSVRENRKSSYKGVANHGGSGTAEEEICGSHLQT